MSGRACIRPRPYLRSDLFAGRSPSGDDVDIRRPGAVRLDPDAERQAVLIEASLGGRGDDRLAPERLPHVRQVQPSVLDSRLVAADLLERVLDLEQVGEVTGGIDPDRQLGRVGDMVEDRQLFVEAEADGALPDDRELGVDVDGPGAGDEEEAGLEVLEVVRRQHVEPQAVDRQDPAGQEPRVEREESGRLGGRCLDIAP